MKPDWWEGPKEEKKSLKDFNPDLIKRGLLEHHRHMRQVMAVFFLIGAVGMFIVLVLLLN